MFEFVWWWVLLLLPLPALLRLLLKPARGVAQAALYVPFYRAVTTVHGTRPILGAPRAGTLLLTMIWLLLLLATARPVWLGDALALPVSGRDLMLAVDISGSMEEDDFAYAGDRITRLQAVKAVAGEFIQRRQGDRVGLIVFGTRAYVQTPLTFDLKTVRHFLNETVIGLAGKNTSIGDAIGLSVKRLRERPANSRVLILLTDGANTAGLISPDEAAQLARDEQIRVHTIGVGGEARTGGLFNFFNQRSSPLDEKALRAIADTTGGRYFRARDIDELSEIYALIDRLEPAETEGEQYRPLTELYLWPLLALCVLAGLYYLRRLQRKPAHRLAQ